MVIFSSHFIFTVHNFYKKSFRTNPKPRYTYVYNPKPLVSRRNNMAANPSFSLVGMLHIVRDFRPRGNAKVSSLFETIRELNTRGNAKVSSLFETILQYTIFVCEVSEMKKNKSDPSASYLAAMWKSM